MSKNIFNSIKLTREQRNMFDLSHDVKLSLNMGELVPIMCTECVPGDKFNLSCESLLRFAPMVAPVMHRMDVTMHYFFVPHRLTWPNWEKFITNTPLESGSPDLPAFPTMTVNSAFYTRLHDYMGIPAPIGINTEIVSALPFAAYQMIWNEYYRDQNLQDPCVFKLIDGSNSDNGDLEILRNRCWEHDYFTAALPFAQKGAAVEMPIIGNVTLDPTTQGTSGLIRAASDHSIGGGGDLLSSDGVGEPQGTLINQVVGDIPSVYDPNGTLIVDSAETTINDLRVAIRLQEWLEKAARGGSRYIENILVQFGIRSSDKRLQRPEYITGTKSPVTISEVLNTTGTEDAPQGNMAGHGVSVTAGKYGNYFCEEHGYIIGIMSVLPKTAYQQGIPKHFLKTTSPFDYYWPSFAHLGEQAVQNREVYAFQEFGSETFGYVPRYAEHKFEQNRVAGDFRNSLNFWHAGRIFDTPPVLNEEFVVSNPTHRIFAVTEPTDQKLWAHVYNKVKASRLMPKFGTPTF